MIMPRLKKKETQEFRQSLTKMQRQKTLMERLMESTSTFNRNIRYRLGGSAKKLNDVN